MKLKKLRHFLSGEHGKMIQTVVYLLYSVRVLEAVDQNPFDMIFSKTFDYCSNMLQ